MNVLGRVLVVVLLMDAGFVAEAVVLDDQPAVTGATHVDVGGGAGGGDGAR